MDAKNAEALRDPGARTVLTHLVNVPSRECLQRAREAFLRGDLTEWSKERPDPETESRAAEFIEKYGHLREFHNPTVNLLYLVLIGRELRRAWAVREEESEVKWVNVILSDIVNYQQWWRAFSAKADAFRGRTKEPLEHPMLTPDFSSGEWTLKPRDLADALAKELMHSRKMLQICEHPECGRYFVKEFSRDRYCSNPCSEEMRKVGQRQWAKAKYAKSSANQETRKKRK